MGAIEDLLIRVIDGSSSELKREEQGSLKARIRKLNLQDENYSTITKLKKLRSKLSFLPVIVWNRFVDERFRYDSDYGTKTEALIRKR